jgi:hypothetical protein
MYCRLLNTMRSFVVGKNKNYANQKNLKVWIISLRHCEPASWRAKQSSLANQRLPRRPLKAGSSQ